MINFFRKIRKKLANDNPPSRRAGKPLKYMRYAIGEIVLVVVGILIALQINNWNEDWKDKEVLKNQLISLKEAFQEDMLNLKASRGSDGFRFYSQHVPSSSVTNPLAGASVTLVTKMLFTGFDLSKIHHA